MVFGNPRMKRGFGGALSVLLFIACVVVALACLPIPFKVEQDGWLPQSANARPCCRSRSGSPWWCLPIIATVGYVISGLTGGAVKG